MSKITDAIELAKRWAADPAHGYDQTNRWGPDYDCSSFLISVWESVGVPVKSLGATYTGNMKSAFIKAGFVDVTDSIEPVMGAGLEPGDICLNEVYHVAMYIGDGRLVEASQNENGGITGGQTGDQTGGEIHEKWWYSFSRGWTVFLRYGGEQEVNPEPLPFDGSTYVVKKGDSWWRIAAEQLGDGLLWEDLMYLNGYTTPDDPIHPGQTIRLWDEGCKECQIQESNTQADNSDLKAYLQLEVEKLGGTVIWH